MLAFCLPLAFFVRTVAYDRAIDAAELQARSLAAELAGEADQGTIDRITRQANGAAASRATVYLAGGRAITGRPGISIAGLAHAAVPPEVKSGHPTTTAGVSGSRNVWEPVRRSRAVAVVVHVLPGELTKGVFRTWAVLFGGGALLVLFAVGLADRLGRSIVRPLQALEDVTHRLRDGDLEQRHEPAGPYEVAEVGEAVNELAYLGDLVGPGRFSGLTSTPRSSPASPAISASACSNLSRVSTSPTPASSAMYPSRSSGYSGSRGTYAAPAFSTPSSAT